MLDRTVSQTGINTFTNVPATRTQGVNAVMSYRSDFSSADAVNWTLSGTYTKIYPAPKQLTPVGGTSPIALFDAEASYTIAHTVTLSVGANNLFNKMPPAVQLVPGTTNFTLVNGGNVLDAPLTFSPYGINGGYYYGRIAVKF